MTGSNSDGGGLPPVLQNIISDEAMSEARETMSEEYIDPLEGIPFSDPQDGEEVVGELTEYEATLYSIYYHSNEAFEQMKRDIGGQKLRDIADRVQRGEDLYDILKQQGTHDTNKSSIPFLRAAERAGAHKAMVSASIRERLDLWPYWVHVRSGRRICKGNVRAA